MAEGEKGEGREKERRREGGGRKQKTEGEGGKGREKEVRRAAQHRPDVDVRRHRAAMLATHADRQQQTSVTDRFSANTAVVVCARHTDVLAVHGSISCGSH